MSGRWFEFTRDAAAFTVAWCGYSRTWSLDCDELHIASLELPADAAADDVHAAAIEALDDLETELAA